MPDGTLSPTLIVIVCLPLLCLPDVKHGFAADLPPAQQRADPVDVAPIIFADNRPQRAVRDQRGEKPQIGREAVLAFAGEIMESLNARVLVFAEQAEIDLGRLARRIAE